ncbi:MAG: hypothetical protein JXA87_14810 [Thermoleophilia bacterium]|nr:hypothetical protein [Thermoleophilia bacterium]
MSTQIPSRRVFVLLSSLSLFVLSVCAADLWAAPGRPPRPKPTPRRAGPKPTPRPANPGPHPGGVHPGPGPAVRPPAKANHGYPYNPHPKHPYAWQAKPHYWNPVVYNPTVTPTIYTTTGYPYYPSGSTYTVVQPVVTETYVPTQTVQTSGETSGQTATDTSPSSIRYTQMLELSEMIHEWRMLNESPEFQARAAAAGQDTSAERRQQVKKIKDLNVRFDRLSREAMQRLTANQDAETKVALARSTIESLVEIADALPEASRPK